jgi:hypothetical protein
MKIPAEPRIGAVVSYSYLWAGEAEDGRREGVKNRPAAIVMARGDLGPTLVAYVLPLTHSPPGPDDSGRKLEIPATIKRHLGLDKQPSWIVLDELNVFAWPGFDLRPVPNSDPSTCEYGMLPNGFFERVKAQMLALATSDRLRIVKRGE